MKDLLFLFSLFLLTISIIHAQETGYDNKIEEVVKNCMNCSFCPDGKEVGMGKICIYFFWGKGCPHCNEEKIFLRELENKYPNLEVYEFEVYYNKTNADFWEEICRKYDIQPIAVPMTFIGEKVFVGFVRTEAKKVGSEDYRIVLFLTVGFVVILSTFILKKLRKVKKWGKN
ncbi:MAG: thioredoxin family protein [Candidatus Aenigmatarchaeota archaeon]